MATASAAKAKNTKKAEKSEPKCDPRKVAKGAVYSRHSFGIITGTMTEGGQKKFGIQNEQGDTWWIDEGILQKEFSFADQFSNEEEVNRTQAIDHIMSNPQTAMTIHYNTKPDPEKIAEALKGGQGKLSKEEWAGLVKTLTLGEERVITGHHFGGFDEHRRLQFFEIDATKGSESQFKLVDLRTVNYVIVKSNKYTVKSR